MNYKFICKRLKINVQKYKEERWRKNSHFLLIVIYFTIKGYILIATTFLYKTNCKHYIYFFFNNKRFSNINRIHKGGMLFFGNEYIILSSLYV